MKRKHSALLKATFVTTLFASLSTSVIAKNPLLNANNDDGIHFMVGAGVLSENSPYKKKAKFKPQFTGTMSWNNFFIDTSSVGYDFSDMIGNDDFELSTHISYQAGMEFPKNDKFEGLKRKSYVDFGLEAGYQIGDILTLGMRVSKDISHRHKGWGTTLGVSQFVTIGSMILQGQVGAEYENDKLSQYRYGVADSEATVHRKAYNAKGSWSSVAQVSAIYPINDHSMIVSSLDYKKLSDKIKKSPLVEADHIYQVGVSYLYSF
ncbi:Outer membrane protein ompV precursor [Phocoenobacter uteri]|uniref:Outer membrane protein ompV n=1 Tax=Phocoenobacter uteri TaxID=146806 RepID=A0A379C9G2_9PAST|nr:MipA/OmpV family protein [Phocoenobacter uteri]MDG6882172.1 hypothetical protein [Phocoenobacter uteri]SUB58326.1 Outer membrane protein ompV precursor [Phocoenobacter uteri]